MNNALSFVAAALVFGLAGCSLYSSEDKGSTEDNLETRPDLNRNGTSSSGGGKSSSSGSSGDPIGEPSEKVVYKGPFVIGDGTGSEEDAKCQSALGVKAPPATGALELPVKLSGKVTQVQVKTSKLCGGDNIYGAEVALVKDGLTLMKKELDFADDSDIVRDSTVTFTASDEEAGFEEGDYVVVILSDESSSGTAGGAFNEIAMASIDVGVIGSGTVQKLGEPATTRSEVEWTGAFSIGDNVWQSYQEEEADEQACRTSLGAGPATSNTKRFTIEIAGEVTDIAFELEKTCGGNGIYGVDLRIYEGDNLLLAKIEADYTEERNVQSAVMHVNAGNAGRPLKPGVYTLEAAATTYGTGFNDIAVDGVRAWVVGKNATVTKK